MEGLNSMKQRHHKILFKGAKKTPPGTRDQRDTELVGSETSLKGSNVCVWYCNPFILYIRLLWSLATCDRFTCGGEVVMYAFLNLLWKHSSLPSQERQGMKWSGNVFSSWLLSEVGCGRVQKLRSTHVACNSSSWNNWHKSKLGKDKMFYW